MQATSNEVRGEGKRKRWEDEVRGLRVGEGGACSQAVQATSNEVRRADGGQGGDGEGESGQGTHVQATINEVRRGRGRGMERGTGECIAE